MAPQEYIVDLPNLEATQDLGQRLGALLFPNAVAGLIGPLGAGKTHFVRAVAEGLGIEDSRGVTSPTFVLIQEYKGRLPIFHFDAYRLRSTREFAELGIDEYFNSNGICLIEWADRVATTLPAERLEITFTVTGECSRRARFVGLGERYWDLLARLL